MFKKRFEELCIEKNVFPTIVCTAIGLSKSAYTKWTDESIPRRATLLKLANYFGVSVEYLKGEVDESEKQLSQEKKNLLGFIETLSDEQAEKIAEMIKAMK